MLYLIDKQHGELGLKFAAMDDEAKVVLIQDGVYFTAGQLPDVKEVYAVKEDVERRGTGARLGSKVTLVDYGGLVDLLMDNKVINFA